MRKPPAKREPLQGEQDARPADTPGQGEEPGYSRHHASRYEIRSEWFAAELCEALNHLLGVNRGDPEEDAQRADAFRALLWGPRFEYWADHPVVHEDAQVRELAKSAIAALDALQGKIKAAEEALAPVLEHLAAQLESAEGSADFGSSYERYSQIRTYLTDFAYVLGEADPRKSVTEVEVPEDALREVARDIRTLLLVQDGARMKHERTVKDIARDKAWYADCPSGVRVEPSLPLKYVERAYAAQRAVNAYLRNQRANFRLVGQPPHFIREACGGQRVDAFFRWTLDPFVDVLTRDPQPVILGVCEECSCVYVRDPLNTNGRTCDTHCTKAARRRRRKARQDPPRS